MEKSKLLQLLNALSAWQLRNLEQFLCSPFFNQRDDMQRLFGFYRAERSKRNPDFSDAAACRALWPDEPAKAADYPNVRSYLHKLVEKYLACKEMLADEILLKMHLARAYEHLGKADAFDRTLRDARGMLKKTPLRNPDYLWRQFRLEYESYDHAVRHANMKEAQLEAVGNMLDAGYFAEKLKLSCAQLPFRDLHPQEHNPGILPELLAFLEQKTDLLSNPAIAIYYYAYLALTDGQDNEIWFGEVRRLLHDCHEQFSGQEIGDIYRICINYCIKRSNRGEPAYTREGFELYRSGVGQGYLLTEGYLSHFTYVNTAAFGITLEEHEWVETFIHDFRNMVSPKSRDSAFSFCLARLRYAQGRYEEAMRLLAEFDMDDPNFFLIAKVMLAKIFYEHNYFDPLESLLDSTRNYLQRHPVENEKKKYFKLFINLMFRLLKLPPNDSKAKKKLKDKVDAMPRAADKNWFLKQLE
ncbi:MAG: HrpB1 family type III secretion system apparatus protein [Thermoanaerobaculia bacterium]|nr:HrpB1 family type III secretion system apparatus protein [Thermoanaerobaculia bacterium]